MIARIAKSVNIALQVARFGFEKSYYQNETIETILGFTDTLTDLPNRKAFERDIKDLDNRYSLVFIDIDNLKSINDTKGHACGDAVLKRLARVLQEAAGVEGKAYRIAGDEFILIDPKSKVVVVCNSVRDTVRKENSFTISQGAVPLLNGQETLEALLHADSAMYQAKAKGKDTTCYHTNMLSHAN